MNKICVSVLLADYDSTEHKEMLKELFADLYGDIVEIPSEPLIYFDIPENKVRMLEHFSSCDWFSLMGVNNGLFDEKLYEQAPTLLKSQHSKEFCTAYVKAHS